MVLAAARTGVSGPLASLPAPVGCRAVTEQPHPATTAERRTRLLAAAAVSLRALSDITEPLGALFAERFGDVGERAQ